LSQADEAFLEDQARRIIKSAALASGASSGAYRNETPFDLHVQGGNMGYPAFWVRDGVMILGGGLIPAAEVEGWIRLIVSTLRGPDDWHVRPGVTVPAYAVPDHVNFDGRATFFPGHYETGDKQGGFPWGQYPPLNDPFWFLDAVHEHWRLTRDLRLFRSRLRTSFSEEILADLCEKVFVVPPSDPESGLVTAGDIETENAKDWGFCDGVFKSGKLLFPSILKIRAARRLAGLFSESGEAGKAKTYARIASRVSAALVPAFLRPASGGKGAWLHSATGTGNQPDVWGSAFAVHSGVLDPRDARAVSLALARAFRDGTAVRDGLVRHLPLNDPVNGGGWERSIIAPGTYQNGGYWGTPVGWYISALTRADNQAAAALAAQYVAFLRRTLRADGTTEAWEWVNEETGQASNPLYVATVALPYLSLKGAGLLQASPG
jgi:hypothetical protein